MEPKIIIAGYILLALVGLLAGTIIGFKMRDRAITSGEIKRSLKLPRGWLVHMISQDMVDGTWSMTAVCITENDENGTCRCTHYEGARDLIELFACATTKIEKRDFLDIKPEEEGEDAEG